MNRRVVRMQINGKAVEAEVEPRKLLVDFIRDDLGLTGTHVGCEHGICGACTISVNGAAVRSCLMLTVQAEGATISTVEAPAEGNAELRANTRSRSAPTRTGRSAPSSCAAGWTWALISAPTVS